MRKRNVNLDLYERLDSDEEDADLNDSMEYIDCGSNALAAFSFEKGFVPSDKPLLVPQALLKPEGYNASEASAEAPEKLKDTRTQRSQPYGITPPVDGEHFEVRRTFLFRKSTVRMLNKLKAEHDNENVYLSSLVDEAIRYYYKYVMENNIGKP